VEIKAAVDRAAALAAENAKKSHTELAAAAAAEAAKAGLQAMCNEWQI
jgi:hypothetical protein